MSYCVNCGVELDASLRSCPLCQTVVYHPGHPVDPNALPPYPKNVGKTEKVDSSELTSLMTIVFVTISVVCGLLNLLVLKGTYWSLYIIGAFAMIWVFLVPVFFRDRVSPYLCIGLDGLVIGLYVGMISLLHPGQGWYLEVALPIILVSTALMECFYLFNVRMKISAIAKIVVIMVIIAAISVSIEILIGFHFQRLVRLTWSAVVLSCCVAVDAILIALALHKGIRNELRRRMHF